MNFHEIEDKTTASPSESFSYAPNELLIIGTVCRMMKRVTTNVYFQEGDLDKLMEGNDMGQHLSSRLGPTSS